VSKNPQVEVGGHHKAVKMGLGDAIQRLMKVEHLYSSGVSKVPEEMLQERKLIVEALNNQFELNLGFDCNDDDVPDTVAIFQQTAQTSCCRILPTEIQKQVQKRSSRASGVEEAQKKRPQDEVEVPVRRHRGLAKTSTPRTRPVVMTPPVMPTPIKEPSDSMVRIFRGLKKISLDPTPA
jgi:hypothetical protein